MRRVGECPGRDAARGAVGRVAGRGAVEREGGVRGTDRPVGGVLTALLAPALTPVPLLGVLLESVLASLLTSLTSFRASLLYNGVVISSSGSAESGMFSTCSIIDR